MYSTYLRNHKISISFLNETSYTVKSNIVLTKIFLLTLLKVQ